jgi:hypothetical protein
MSVNSLKLIQNSTNLTMEELVILQKENNILLPSDFEKIALTENGFKVEYDVDTEYVNMKMKNGDEVAFDFCIDVRSISDYIEILEMYDETDGLDLVKNYLPFISTGGRDIILMGYTVVNMNEIYYFSPVYNPQTGLGYTLEKQTDNYVDFLTNQVTIEKY